MIIRPEVEAEIHDAFSWYEEQIPGLGADFLLNLDAAFQGILRNPLQYPVIYRTLRRALVRRFPYQVMFLEGKNKIIIIAVFHGKRNPKRWQHRPS